MKIPNCKLPEEQIRNSLFSPALQLDSNSISAQSSAALLTAEAFDSYTTSSQSGSPGFNRAADVNGYRERRKSRIACLSVVDRSLKLRITALASDAGYAGSRVTGFAGDAGEK